MLIVPQDNTTLDWRFYMLFGGCNGTRGALPHFELVGCLSALSGVLMNSVFVRVFGELAGGVFIG
jgi:hypothetical protein